MTNIAVQLILAVLLPTLLVCAVPQRWLKRAMIGWLVAPVLVFFAVIIWEIVTGPPVEDAAGKALSGLMILSSILAIPWIAVSVVGFGIGYFLRRFLWPWVQTAGQSAAIPGDDVQQQADCIAKFRPKPIPEGSIVVSGWRNVDIGFETDDLVNGGLAVWKHEWRRVAEPPCRIPLIRFRSIAMTFMRSATRPRRSALRSPNSNGVWGFYVPDTQR